MVNPIPEGAERFRILVADDRQEIRDLLFETFSSRGYAVTCVKDGLEALASLQASVYDLLITDYVMPRLDGLTLLKCVQAGNNCPRSIVITAYGPPDFVEQVKQAGATTVLFKPFATRDIIALVEEIKDRRTDP